MTSTHYSHAQIVRHLKISRIFLKALLPKDSDLPKDIDFVPFQINKNKERNINENTFNSNLPNDRNTSDNTTDAINVDCTTNFKHGQSICHIIKPNGSKLVIETPDPKSIIQAFLCCN